MIEHALHHVFYDVIGTVIFWVSWFVLGSLGSIWESIKAFFAPPKAHGPTYSCLDTTAEEPRPSPSRQEYLDECERLRKLDALGSPTAAYRLYALIRNKEPRNPEWLACLKRAAHELDNYEAQYKLASGYENGSIREDGITEEDIVALYRRSAAQGYRKASNRLKALGIVEDEAASADA